MQTIYSVTRTGLFFFQSLNPRADIWSFFVLQNKNPTEETDQ